MTQENRIQAFNKLGIWMLNLDEYSLEIIQKAQFKNPWYTPDNILKQLKTLGENLTEENLSKWLANYPFRESDKIVGLVLAGNLPLVGFHDILTVLISGFSTQIKISSDDANLTSLVIQKLLQLEPSYTQKINIVDRLANFDLIIATGSNNSARYFEYYFSKKPHIIRKNRNAVAILSGKETKAELAQLGCDIFDYFGLGCRSVAKLYIPKNYNIATFYEAIEQFSEVNRHFKYNNNYDYNKSIYLINADKHYDNGFLLLKEDTAITSPLAVLYYEEYNDIREVKDAINAVKETIQCVVTNAPIDLCIPTFAFGASQSPSLDDYADGVNTLKFLFENQ